MFWTIPTLMTWTRIVAIPLIVGVFYASLDPATRNLIATVMFIVFAATDWLDGYLARKLNQTSSFGAFLDPVADKFLVCASHLALVYLLLVQLRQRYSLGRNCYLPAGVVVRHRDNYPVQVENHPQLCLNLNHYGHLDQVRPQLW